MVCFFWLLFFGVLLGVIFVLFCFIAKYILLLDGDEDEEETLRKADPRKNILFAS